jgi:hypothetical protein
MIAPAHWLRAGSTSARVAVRAIVLLLPLLLSACFEHEAPLVTRPNTLLDSKLEGVWLGEGSDDSLIVQVTRHAGGFCRIGYQHWLKDSAVEVELNGYAVERAGHRFIAVQMKQVLNLKTRESDRTISSLGKWDYFVFRIDSPNELRFSIVSGKFDDLAGLDRALEEAATNLHRHNKSHFRRMAADHLPRTREALRHLQPARDRTP